MENLRRNLWIESGMETELNGNGMKMEFWDYSRGISSWKFC